MISPFYPNYFYTTDDVRIFYTTNFKIEDLKTDEKVYVFNYGLICNVQHFKYQIQFFNMLGYKVLYYDYRFHFSSSKTNSISDLTFDKMVNDLNELLTSLNIKKSFMIGHSMGVNITLEFAKKHPKMLSAMVLISGTVIAPHDIMFDTNAMELAIPLIKSFVQSQPNLMTKIWESTFKIPLARNAIHRGGFNINEVSDDFIQTYMKKISELTPKIFLQLMDEMKKHDILQFLDTIKVPSLIIGGDDDQVIPNYLQNILHNRLEKSELYIVKNGSHVPQVDFPDSINERMQLFFQKYNSVPNI